MHFDRDAYLNRIGFNDTVFATEDGLEALHRAQVYAIPYENFDIHLGRPIFLDPRRVFEKMVERQRGGYCFELNKLFGMVLGQFGFKSRPLLARVHLGDRLFPRTHLVNLVRLDGRDWIADVGFGSNQLRAPIPLELNRIEVRDGQQFRLVDGGEFGTMMQTKEGADWQNLYSFDMGHVWPIDIEMGNYFTSTHPDIFFTWARVATLPRPSGKITLLDFCLREFSHGEETVTTLEPGPSYLSIIESKFGIHIDEPYEALKPLGYLPSENSLDLSAPSNLSAD